MMQAKQITETSFILMTDIGDRFGVLTKNSKLDLYTSDMKTTFERIEDLEELFGEPVHFIKPIEHSEKDNIDVGGYPVKHEEVFEIEEGKFTTYKTGPNSRVRWVPGWWGIKFTRGFIAFFCPKLATLTENDFIGPFKNKFDVEHAVKLKNQEIRSKE